MQTTPRLPRAQKTQTKMQRSGWTAKHCRPKEFAASPTPPHRPQLLPAISESEPDSDTARPNQLRRPAMSIATASSRTATASSRTATASSSTTEAGVGPRDRSVPTRTLLTGLLLTLLTGTAVIHASSAAADQHAAATALRAPTPYEATYQARARGMRTDAYRYLRATDDEIFEVSHGLSVSILGANLITVQETSQFRWAD